jgi:hypothetical protein
MDTKPWKKFKQKLIAEDFDEEVAELIKSIFGVMDFADFANSITPAELADAVNAHYKSRGVAFWVPPEDANVVIEIAKSVLSGFKRTSIKPGRQKEKKSTDPEKSLESEAVKEVQKSDNTKDLIVVKGQLKILKTAVSFEGVFIGLFDQELLQKEPIAVADIDDKGVFSVRIEPRFVRRLFSGRTPEVFFKVFKDGRLVYSTQDEITITLKTGMHSVTIKLPESLRSRIAPKKPEMAKTPISNLLSVAGIEEGSAGVVTGRLRELGIKDLKTLLENGGRIKDEEIGLAESQFTRLRAVAKFNAASNSLELSKRLVDKKLYSFAEIAAIPLSRLEEVLDVRDSGEKKDLKRLHLKSKSIRNHVSNYVISRQRFKSKDGGWHFGSRIITDAVRKNQCTECELCENVFSPRAYLFDLLYLIYYHWGITTNTLEKILLQEIDALGCEEGLSPIPQVELGIEVLEKYIGESNIPITNTKFQKFYKESWFTLLGIEEKELEKALPPSGTPLDAPGLAKSQKLASLVLKTNPDLAAIREVRNLLTPPEDGNKDELLAELSRNYQDSIGQFSQLLNAAYGSVLEQYREALIKKTGETVSTMQDKLFIDLRSGACHQTNRITQLILSLQTFILSIRTGGITSIKRPDLGANVIRLNDLKALPVEEASWKWLKDYQAWGSAIYALLYTENVLPPPLFGEGYSERYKEVRDTLLHQPVDPKKVREVYLDYRIPKSHINFQQIIKETYPDSPTVQRVFMIGAFENSLQNLDEWISLLENVISGVIQEYSDETGWVFLIDLLDVIEKYLFFPLLAGWALNRAGEFAAAHDWYRLLYDPEKPVSQRLGFDFHGTFADSSTRSSDWFAGVLDPQEIALRRKGVYLRSVILSMVKNVLDWADHEYTIATPESLSRARYLYELARKILQSPDLGDACGRAIEELKLNIIADISLRPNHDLGKITRILDDLYKIRNRGILEETIEKVEDIFNFRPDPGNIDPSPIEETVAVGLAKDRAIMKGPTIEEDFNERQNILVSYEEKLLFSADERVAPDYPAGSSVFGSRRSTAYSMGSGFGRVLPFHLLIAEPLAYTDDLDFITYEEVPVSLSVTFCVPANPLLKALGFYIEMSLLKLQHCLNIAGEPMEAAVMSEGTMNEFLAVIAEDVERKPSINLLAYAATDQPRYRYSFLVEKARQYTDVAQRLGSALLLAYEKKEEERFRKLQAKHVLELARAMVTMKQLSLREARHGLDVALLQIDRADAQLGFWEKRIEEGWLSETEQFGLNLMVGSIVLQGIATLAFGAALIPAAASAGIGAMASVAGSAATASVALAKVGIPVTAGGFILMAGGAAAAAAALPVVGQTAQSAAGFTGTWASFQFNLSSFERRWEDWNLQRDLSDFDLQITKAQKILSEDRIDIAGQDLKISNLNQAHAQEVLEFLENKFNNEQFYEWMVTVLIQNYRAVMQIATTVARMAQRALEFERQEKVELILGDYWSLSTADLSAAAELTDKQKGSGILGAERLVADLTKLDSYKLQTDRRRFELSKTISMAQMLPSELVYLRSVGKVTFNTLLDWFDRDFPGHYLRLIKSLRLSVLALVPPMEGIHAMLTNTGESSVVVYEGAAFVKKRAIRSFGETIGLDSPFNDTGLFVLDYNDPMFLPFEGLGVETQWTFELPRATNRFNFDTIADVLFTIEYTAFHDAAYENEVRQRIGDEATNEVILDLKNFYPDEWYHFMNPLPSENSSSSGREIKINLLPQMLPQNFRANEEIKTEHITLLVSGDFEDLSQSGRDVVLSAFTVSKDEVIFSSAGTPPAGQIEFNSRVLENSFALFSTRAQGQPANSISEDIAPEREWTIKVDADLEDTNNSISERIRNIILVLTVRGKLAWPSLM